MPEPVCAAPGDHGETKALHNYLESTAREVPMVIEGSRAHVASLFDGVTNAARALHDFATQGAADDLGEHSPPHALPLARALVCPL